MKILFIGLGSIGTRHLRNITYLLSEKNQSFEVHALRSTTNLLNLDVAKLLQKQMEDFNELDNFYDMIFITNPTVCHYETLKNVVNKTNKIFLEKPVFSSIDVDLGALNINHEKICYVAAPLRYTRVFEYLKNLVSKINIYSARVICSSYLPEWRPTRDYRKCYSANKESGGDISLELIHEWDYLVELFGIPQNISMISGKYSNLEITSDDIAIYIAEYRDMLVSLSLDYFGRYVKREIELYCDDDVIVGDFIKNEIRFLRSGHKISLSEARDDYQIKELNYFLSLDDEKNNHNSISHAFDVLKLAKGILK